MPVRKRKCLRRRKKTTNSRPLHKEDSQSLRYDDIQADSSKINKTLCKLCKKHAVSSTDKSDVKRLFSPFNRFANNSTKTADKLHKPKKMTYQSISHPTGLSQKEKSYVICSCEARANRYQTLKNLAAEAVRDNKIFTVYGSCNAVRKALLERGWVEKIPPNRMNLSHIRDGTFSTKSEIFGELERLLLSNFVEKCRPNFVWRTKDEFRETNIDMSKEYPTMCNKLKIDAMWTTKQGLCSSMKRNYWFYIEDVAEVNAPRSYNSNDPGEIEGFVMDYKMTACTSLLKWILSMVANERPVFLEIGKVSMNVIVFALNRCKEYLFRKQHKDIDDTVSPVSPGQWNAFLRKYYRIIAKDDVFEADKDNRLPLYLVYAKFLLKEIHRYRPQLSCEGCHNIWIIKPAHCSRGRGIRLASKLEVITNLLVKATSKYVIQKYIEEPLLIHDTKFDIRQYYLVTSTYPLVIWMYKDCYLKFSSQKYSLRNYHESIHLTNNAVQRKYNNYVGRHKDLPQNNMWDSDKYKDYLNMIGKNKVWDNIIYPGMKKSIVGIMMSCQDNLSVCKNRFELYGCDFILDKEYRPWLIEINSCPDLNYTTHVTGKICPAVISDIIKVVIDKANNRKSPTGKFECIFKQPMTIPRYGAAADLFIRGYGLPLDYFYKGNIQVKEVYENADLDKEYDLKSILNKLKQLYDNEVMVEPEVESASTKKKTQEIGSQITPSEYELSVAATVITGQLDELLDRITSEPSISTRSSQNEESFSLLSPKRSLSPSSLTKWVKSVTDISALLKKSCNRFASSEGISLKHTFNFSKLDDGLLGKGSIIELNNIKRIFKSLSTLVKIRELPGKVPEKQSLIKAACKPQSQNLMLDSSAKIISFLDQKEREYFNDLSRNTL